MSDQNDPNPLAAFSQAAAGLVYRTQPSVVGVHGPGRASSSGFLWRENIVVTADEAMSGEEDLSVSLPQGERVPAAVIGRDPSTDVALLRVEAASAPALELDSKARPAAGEFALAIGHSEGRTTAHLGLVSSAGGPWRSMAGGKIDSYICLDLRLDRHSEGGPVVNTSGKVIGMAVFGARRSVLVIPAETIDRVAEQLLTRGRITRGYLGLGLQPVRIDQATAGSLSLAGPRGIIVISVDSQGPGGKAGFLQGDVITSWNGEPVRGVRETLSRLGPESVGSVAEFGVLRGGQPIALSLTIGERGAA